MRRALGTLACLLLLLAPLAAAPAGDEPLLAGFGTSDLTPTRPVPLAGYAARLGRLSTGVHDPVKARAMVVGVGEAKVAVVSVDLVGVSREAKDAVVEAVKNRGFTHETVLLAATHTHSGPGGLARAPLFRPMTGAWDADLFAETTRRIARAIHQADDARQPARLAWAKAPARDLHRNRGDAGGGVEPDLEVLRVDTPEGHALGVVTRFAAHPTILGAENLEVSADWPGAFCDAMEAAFPGATALLLQGCVGDQSPAGGEGEGFARVLSYGRAVAAAASAAAAKAAPLPGRVEARRAVVPLPPTVGGLLLGRGRGGLVPEEAVEAEVQGVVLGEGAAALRWFAVPGEPSVAAGAHGAYGLVGCANDHLGYLCDDATFFAGGYEGSLDLVGPTTGNPWLERALHQVGLAVHLRGPVGAGEWADRGGATWVRGAGPDGAYRLGRAHGEALREKVRDLLRRAEKSLVAEAEKNGAFVPLIPFALATGLHPRDLVIPMLVRAARTLQPRIPPESLREMVGLAEGAGVPYDAVLLENTFLTLAEQTHPERLISLPVRCTNAAVLGDATTLGQPILFSTLDWGLPEVLRDTSVVLAVEPPTGHPFVSVTWPGMVGTLRAMGAQGLAVVEESVASREDTSLDGMPVNFLLRQVVQHAGSLDEALATVASTPGTCGYHLTVLDGHRRDARVVEVTARRRQVRAPKDGALCGCDDTDGAVFEGPRDPEVPRSDGSSTKRYAAVREALAADAGRIDARWGLERFLAARGVRNDGTLLACAFEPQVGRVHVALGAAVAEGEGPWRAHDLASLLSGEAWARYAPPPRVESPGTWEVGKTVRVGPVTRTPLAFDSPRPSGVPANDRVQAVLFQPAERLSAGTVIQLPAWRERDLMAESALSASMAAQGLAVLLFPLPWQISRAAPGVRSGEWTLSPDLARTREAWVQGMADVARASLWLEVARGVPPSRQGLLGVSLGGHVGAAAFGAYRDRFAAGAFVLAGGGLDRMLAGDDPLVAEFRARLAGRGGLVDDVRDLLRPLDPATWADAARRDGVLLVGARADALVPPAHVEALAEAYGGARVVWLEGGHEDGVRQPMAVLRLVSEVGRHFVERFGAGAPSGGR